MTTFTWGTFSGSQVFFREDDNETFIGVEAYEPEEAHATEKEDWINRGDLRIVNAARVSNLVKPRMKSYEVDKKLVRYLWENKHWSPFEQVSFTFTVVTDLRTAMQMDTYRTWKKNRYSRRYSHDWVEFVKPIWRIQNTEKGSNKQGSDKNVDPLQGGVWSVRWEKLVARAIEDYSISIQEGMAREQAAWFLPTGVLTSTFYTVDLRNLVNFIYQRCDPHAQREIQAIAYIFKNQMLSLTNPWVKEMVDEQFEKNEWRQYYDEA